MHQIAPDVFHLPLTPRNGVNAYLIGDVLVDTGLPTSAGKLKNIVRERGVKTIALTHAHGDHVGSARKLKDEFDLPVWVGTKDRDAAEAGKAVKKDPFNAPGLSLIAGALGDFKAVPVSRVLNEGDEKDDLRKAMVGIFTELGADSDLARAHRRRMAASMY